MMNFDYLNYIHELEGSEVLDFAKICKAYESQNT